MAVESGNLQYNVFNGTIWDDHAVNSAVEYHEFVTGQVATVLRPYQAFERFNGSDPNGNWTLAVRYTAAAAAATDAAAATGGGSQATLLRWAIHLDRMKNETGFSPR